MRRFTSQWRRPNPNRPKWWPFDVQSSADSTFCSLTDWPTFFVEFNKWTNSPLTSTWVESWGSFSFLLYSRERLKELKLSNHTDALFSIRVSMCHFMCVSGRIFERMFSPLLIVGLVCNPDSPREHDCDANQSKTQVVGPGVCLYWGLSQQSQVHRQ